MRFVVFGAGSVGGVAGGRLAQHGHDVALIARGDHYAAIRDRGLSVESADGRAQIPVPVVNHPSQLSWTSEDVVLLTVKTQDTEAALDDLAAVAPANVPVVCVQNGVANERMALRRFAHVYAVYVWCASSHLSPGIVQAWHSPTTGVLDIGRYPEGVDDLAETIASAFRSSTFFSKARPDVMRFKYRKLISNLGNAVEALCGSAPRESAVLDEARREAEACFAAAGIQVAGDDEDFAERERTLALRSIDGMKRGGGSSWQSLARARGTIECDYLNGEIALLGRLFGVPTPANELLQSLANRAARERRPPGSISLAELEAMRYK